VNAWSEITAMIAPVIIYCIAKYGFGMEAPYTMFPTVLGTSVIWVAVTLFTKPVEESRLSVFYEKIHPGGIGWVKYRKLYPNVKADSGYGRLFMQWILALIAVYSTLFGIGQLLFEGLLISSLWLGISVVSFILIYWLNNKR
jgi:hypothetical protein